MTKELARVESFVNLVLGKPVAVVVYGIIVISRWTAKRITSAVTSMRCRACTMSVRVPRKGS